MAVDFDAGRITQRNERPCWKHRSYLVAVGLPVVAHYFLPGSRNRDMTLEGGPNTVSESTVSNTKLCKLFAPRRVPGTELSEFLSAYDLFQREHELTEFFFAR